jgi:uncharacterized protein (TIGR00369 family)
MQSKIAKLARAGLAEGRLFLYVRERTPWRTLTDAHTIAELRLRAARPTVGLLRDDELAALAAIVRAVVGESSSDVRERVRASFARQGLMRTLGAELATVTPGNVEITAPLTDAVSQQHGMLHAGVTMALVDTACGYAALTLMPPDQEVLTVEFKVNLLAPGRERRVEAVGTVLRPGRTLTICRGDVHIVGQEGDRTHIATVLATMAARRT